MKTKFLIVPLVFIFLALLVSASSVTTSIFYDSTNLNSLQIRDGNNFGITVSADSVLENIKTIKVDLLTSSGSLVRHLIDISNYNGDSYFNNIIIGETEYSNPGNYTINSTVTGASGQTATSILNLEVSESTQGNNPPVLNPIGNKQINENELLEFTISATDADNDSLTFPQPTDLPTGAILTDNTDGTATFSWTPDYTQSGTYNVTFTVSDGIDIGSETITITVNNINRIPSIASILDSTINEGETYNYQVIATDADEDTLTYSLTTNQNWLSINSTTGLITGTAHEISSDESYNIEVEVSDGNGGTNTQTYTLTVKDVPPEEDITVPKITILSPQSTTYSSHIEELHYKIYDENIDVCEYSIDNGQTKHELDCNNGENTYINLNSVEGENTWIVYAKDKAGNTANKTVTFTIDTSVEDKDAPIIIIISPENKKYETSTIKLKIITNEDATVWFNLNNGEDIPMFNLEDHIFTYTLTLSDGQHTVTFYATDAARNVAKVTIEFTIDTTDSDDDKDKDNDKKYTNYYQSNYEEELYLDQFKNKKIIYLDTEVQPDEDMTFWQKFVAWLKKIFGFN